MGKLLSALVLLALLQSAHAEPMQAATPPAPVTFALTVSDGKLAGPGADVQRGSRAHRMERRACRSMTRDFAARDSCAR